jgi:hypothetical protein
LRRRELLAGAVVLALSLGGCGDDGPEASNPGPSAPTVRQGPFVLGPLAAEGFSVTMPTDPQRLSRPLVYAGGVAEQVGYTAINENSGYTVLIDTYPEGTKLDLDESARTAGASLGGTVEDVVSSTFRGQPARDFRIVGTGGTARPVVILVRILLGSDNRLFQLLYSSTEEPAVASAAFKAFANSFRFT